MKQTIISKCFDKMKRVALTLFAALCVGNMWAAIAIDIKDMAFTEDGTLSFQYQLGYSESDSVRYAYLEVEVIDSADNAKTSQVLISKEDMLQLKNHDVLDWASATIEGVGYASLEALLADQCGIKISFKAFKENEDFSSYDYKVYIAPSSITSLEARYSVSAKEFTVYGSYDLNAGVTGLELAYALNDAALSNPTTVSLVPGNDGTFSYTIPYSAETDVLYYSLTVLKGEIREIHRDAGNASKIFGKSITEGYATYTWTGDVDNIWANPSNWTFEGDSLRGYPGIKSGSWYLAIARFSKDADVDLNGGEYYLLDNNRGFEMAEGITVKLRNGTLGFQPHNDGSAVSLNFGKNNSTIVLKDVAMPFNPAQKTTAYNFRPVAGSTIIMDGSETYYWNFYPGRENTKFYVQNGTLSTSYKSATPGSGSQVVISNGLWIVKTNVGSGLAAKTIFRDGPNMQGRLWLRNSSTGSTYYNLKLYGTYDFKLPATSYSTPYVLANKLSANATCTINIDVSDNSEALRIPIIQFMGTMDDNTKKAMNTMVSTASKLVVRANGADVKAARNAKLVWDLSAKTLYYQQDSENAALVDGVEYATLGDAFAAVQAGGTVKLLRDNLEIAEMLSITKDFTIDLNGRTLKETVTPAEGEDRGAIYVGVGKTLTVTDSLSFGKITSNGDIVIGNYGTVIVNKGTIEAGADDENDVSIYNFYYSGSIYGKATVNGGSIGRIWNCGTLNITAGTVADVDNSGAMTIAASATVTKILLKNGSDAAEVPGAGTITAPEGLEIESDVEGYKAAYENGVYTLVVDTVTVAPGGAAAVVDTEADADAVEIAVEVPAGVDISLDAYKAYFTKSVTQNSEGKYEVTAILKDEVKPVISTTKPAITFEDGKVTVNVDNELPGLYYGVRYATTVEGVEDAEPVAGFTVTPEEGDTAGFFRVVVDFAPIPEAE